MNISMTAAMMAVGISAAVGIDYGAEKIFPTSPSGPQKVIVCIGENAPQASRQELIKHGDCSEMTDGMFDVWTWTDDQGVTHSVLGRIVIE